MKARKYTLILILILIIAGFLRLWRIDQVPVSLFGDELDVGYHALSVLKTGRDYSGNLFPLHFQSLAEWRTPLYLYSAIPTVALFGISPLGVRLPAVLFGLLSIWGMYLLVRELLNTGGNIKKFSRKAEIIALVSAAVLAFSPWHIQYSRAAFEVTQLLAFLIFGLYFFYKSLKMGKYLWVSAILFAFTPWIYSTAKLFTPALLLFLLIIYRKDLAKLQRKYIVRAVIALLIVGLPIFLSTLFGGGAQRFTYLSVLGDPKTAGKVDELRLADARSRTKLGNELMTTPSDRAFHNKGTITVETIVTNYLQPVSVDFLFINGDPNLRHSIKGVGQFYWLEFITLFLGVVLFFGKFKDKKVKYVILFWIAVGILPSALTRDGGNHATRLILILPPLAFLISYGLIEGLKLIKPRFRVVVVVIYIALWLHGIAFYQHHYWVHNPSESEIMWQSGYEDAIQSIFEIEKDYDRVFLSMTEQPIWIFFAGWSEYSPQEWQNGYPFEKAEIEGFGEMDRLGKYYFGGPQAGEGGLFALPRLTDDRVLYLANASEIGENLILEPGKKPVGLKLIKAIPYLSGEPAFYIFETEE